MANVLVQESSLEDIADAIRSKNGTQNTYKPAQMAAAIQAISGGGSTLGTKSITNNGTYNASSDNLDGYSQVTVTVPASAVDTGTKSITANGNNQDVVGYAAVNVNVPNSYSAGDEGKVVSSGALVSQTAHADVTPTTSDQTIDTTLNNSLKVKGDADLVAGNIKKDVEIFGVTGSYEGSGGGATPDDIANGSFPSGDIVLTVSTKNYAFFNCKNITSVTMADGTDKTIGGNCFNGCTGLLWAFGRLGQNNNAFYGCTSIQTYVSTNVASKSGGSNQMFYGCTSLEAVDITHRQNVGLSSSIGTEAYRNCSKLKTIVLREATIYSLGNTNSFNGTPFANGGTGGDIYIPKTLYDALGTGTNDYEAASNWSTINGYGTITWHAIEGSYYETHYADGTLIPTT